MITYKLLSCILNCKQILNSTSSILFRVLTTKPDMNIQTFVFLDTETTGLPFEEGNRTKITEMCIAAVQADHISLGVFPRVLNKLNLCFNPLKAIAPTCKDLTGLSNELLHHQSKFQKDTVEIIASFLALQAKPLCLVAHNGNYFDYPILQAEIYNAGGSLPDDILCVDSLQAFRELESQSSMEQLNIQDHSSQANVPVELCDGFDKLLIKIAEDVEASESTVNEVQRLNERTPSKKVNFVSNAGNTSNVNDMYYMPDETVKGVSKSEEIKKKNLGKSSVSRREPAGFRRQSFKLTEVYTRLTNKEPTESHKAEGDCLMLIECTAKIGEMFIHWANANAKKFSNVPMMQPGRKFGR